MNFNLPVELYDCKNNCVFIAIKKDLLNIIFIKNQTDLISHLYGIILEITIDHFEQKAKKKLKVVNIYDDKLEKW